MAKSRSKTAPLTRLLRQYLPATELNRLATLLTPLQGAARLGRYPLLAGPTATSSVRAAIAKATGERPKKIVLLSAGRALRKTEALEWELHWWLMGRRSAMPFWDLVDLQLISLGAADPQRGLSAEDQEVLGQGIWDLMDPVCHALDNFVSHIWKLSDAGAPGQMSDDQIQDTPAWDLTHIPSELLRLFLEFTLSGEHQLSQRLEETIRIVPYYLPLYERLPGEWVVLCA